MSNTTHLSNTILIAPYIEIEQGFVGSCQILATDSIVIGSDVIMEYPSAVLLHQEVSTEKSSFVTIGQNTHIQGTVVAYQTVYDYKKPVLISFEGMNSLKGNLYTNGLAQLKGEFIGDICINKLFLRTSATTYISHLQNVIINKVSLPKAQVPVWMYAQENAQKVVLEWLK